MVYFHNKIIIIRRRALTARKAKVKFSRSTKEKRKKKR
jgi:hypothetical protein